MTQVLETRVEEEEQVSISGNLEYDEDGERLVEAEDETKAFDLAMLASPQSLFCTPLIMRFRHSGYARS